MYENDYFYRSTEDGPLDWDCYEDLMIYREERAAGYLFDYETNRYYRGLESRYKKYGKDDGGIFTHEQVIRSLPQNVRANFKIN